MNQNRPMVFEDGRQMRDFVNVGDVVQANMLAIQRSEADGKTLNIGSGEAVSIREVAAALTEALRTGITADLTGRYRVGDIRHCFADISAARTLLGYQPKVRFADGMRDLLEWLQSHRAQARVAEAAAHLRTCGLTA